MATETVRFRLLVARTDVDEYVVIYAMDESVLDGAGEGEWIDAVAPIREGWPDEYDYAHVTVSIPAEQVGAAFPREIEVEGSAAREGERA